MFTPEQQGRLGHVTVAHRKYRSAAESLELSDRALRRACARAHISGISIRGIARYAGVSGVTVSKWIASVPEGDLDRYAVMDRVEPAPRRESSAPMGRPGLRGRRSKRRKA